MSLKAGRLTKKLRRARLAARRSARRARLERRVRPLLGPRTGVRLLQNVSIAHGVSNTYPECIARHWRNPAESADSDATIAKTVVDVVL